MPLARIDLLRGRSDEQLAAIGSCVQTAMIRELGVPERDRFQILTEHDATHLIFSPSYLDIERSSEWILVQVTLAEGRTTEAKQAFYATLADLLGAEVGLRREDLAVSLVENARENWSFGNGEASYVVLPKDAWR